MNYYPPLSDLCSDSSLPHQSDESEILCWFWDQYWRTMGSEVHSHPSWKELKSPESNSAYVMTRSSQEWFRHGIYNICTPPTAAQPPVEAGRFFITLRTVNKKFKRSTIIIGDSNTKLIQFGSGKGTIGEPFPGARVKDSKVIPIDSRSCIG